MWSVFVEELGPRATLAFGPSRVECLCGRARRSGLWPLSCGVSLLRSVVDRGVGHPGWQPGTIPGLAGPSSELARSLSALQPPGFVAEKGSVHRCFPMRAVVARGADPPSGHQSSRLTCIRTASYRSEGTSLATLRRTLDRAPYAPDKYRGEGVEAADTPPDRKGAMRAAALALSIVRYVLLRSPRLLWAASSLADPRGSHMLWLIPPWGLPVAGPPVSGPSACVVVEL